MQEEVILQDSLHRNHKQIPQCKLAVVGSIWTFLEEKQKMSYSLFLDLHVENIQGTDKWLYCAYIIMSNFVKSLYKYELVVINNMCDFQGLHHVKLH